MATATIQIPAWISITQTKEAEVQSVVIGPDAYRPGQSVVVEVGQAVKVRSRKGQFEAVATESGFCVAGLYSDGSRKAE